MFMLMLTLFFIVLSKFYVEKQVSKFLATRSGYSREQQVLATHFGDSPSRETQVMSSSRSFRDSLMTHLQLAKIFATRQSQNAQKQLFKVFFMGNLF